jgi:alcohol dehydrogenase (NADP+)
MADVLAYAADSADGPFYRTTIKRRDVGPRDVAFDVKFAGICHSDIHTKRGEWGPVHYPLVPGHELGGIVTAVGSEVTRYQVGDRVGVGCFVYSCGECAECKDGMEQFCSAENGTIWTYGSPDYLHGGFTDGGYSQATVVDENYLCRVPETLDLAAATPLMCAGITLYSPLKRWGAGPGKRVAIIGMGGLGHVGVQIAKAMGATVAVISQGRSKEADGRRFGADEYYATSEEGTYAKLKNSFDLVISTISSGLDLDLLLGTVRVGGALVDVGLPEHPSQIHVGSLTGGNKVLAGSTIGGIGETQEMLDFCATHGITAQIELIGGEDITEAYDKVVNSAVRYRYVIDTSTF